jgi:hypothetical protein
VIQEESGSASGVLKMMQQVGSSIGIAILGTIFFNSIGSSSEISEFTIGARHAIWSAVGILILTISFVFLLSKKIHQRNEDNYSMEDKSEEWTNRGMLYYYIC